jgi:transposase-like protein
MANAAMKTRISKTLRFWVDVAREQRKARTSAKSKQSLIAEILREWEEAGDARRYLDHEGRIAWKATQRMIDRLADAERDAKDELDEWP